MNYLDVKEIKYFYIIYLNLIFPKMIQNWSFWYQLALILTYSSLEGLPGVTVVKNAPTMQETQEMKVWFVNLEYPPEEEMATHSSILS